MWSTARPSATSRPRRSSTGSTAPRPPTRTIVMGDFNADPGEPAYARMRAAGFRSAYAEANGAEPAVTWPSGPPGAGDGHRRRAGCLDYIWVRGRRSTSIARGSCSIARRSTTRRSTQRPPRHQRAPGDRLTGSARTVAARDPPTGPSRRLAARAGEHDRGVPGRRWPSRAATGSSSTSACRPTASRSCSMTRPSNASRAGPDRVDDLTVDGAGRPRRPDARDVLAAAGRGEPSSTSS